MNPTIPASEAPVMTCQLGTLSLYLDIMQGRSALSALNPPRLPTFGRGGENRHPKGM